MSDSTLWEWLSSYDPLTVLSIAALLVFVFGWWKPGRTVTDAVIATLAPLFGALYDNLMTIVGLIALSVLGYFVLRGWLL